MRCVMRWACSRVKLNISDSHLEGIPPPSSGLCFLKKNRLCNLSLVGSRDGETTRTFCEVARWRMDDQNRLCRRVMFYRMHPACWPDFKWSWLTFSRYILIVQKKLLVGGLSRCARNADFAIMSLTFTTPTHLDFLTLHTELLLQCNRPTSNTHTLKRKGQAGSCLLPWISTCSIYWASNKAWPSRFQWADLNCKPRSLTSAEQIHLLREPWTSVSDRKMQLRLKIQSLRVRVCVRFSPMEKNMRCILSTHRKC